MVTIKSQKPIRKSYRARRKGGNMTTECAVARARFAEGLPDPSANSFCRGEPETWTGHSCWAPTTEKPNHGSGFLEDALVVGFVGGDYVVGAEFFLGVEAGGFAHFAAAVGSGQDFDGVAGGFLHITGLHQESIYTVLDNFWDAADVGGDNGDFAGHGFEGGKAEGFELGGEQEKIGGGQFFVDGILFAKEEDVFLKFFLAHEIFGGAAIRAVADEDELGGHFSADDGENFDGVCEALDRAEIREVHEDGFAVGSPLCGEAFVGGAIVKIAVHEIRDDFDGALDFEFFERLLEQIAGDGGDAVALLDGKTGDGKIAAIAADESNVRAMESGDEREAARRGHGAREQGADGMRNGVVNVEQVERFGFEDFQHLCGEGEGVGRMVEERVGHDFDFVEMDVRIVGVHADRRGVTDEMNVVAAGGEFHAEFGGDDARAAVSGVTGDADAHKMCFRVPVWQMRAVTIQQFRFWLTATSRKR